MMKRPRRKNEAVVHSDFYSNVYIQVYAGMAQW